MNGRNKMLSLAALVIGLLVITGCTTHQVRTPSSDPLQQTYQKASPQAYFWGLVLSPQVVAAKCADGLNDVVAKRNYLYDLASVLTFGIWMPSEVEFRCRAPRGESTVFPNPRTRP